MITKQSDQELSLISARLCKKNPGVEFTLRETDDSTGILVEGIAESKVENAVNSYAADTATEIDCARQCKEAELRVLRGQAASSGLALAVASYDDQIAGL
jgi:hypothetical protein